SGKSVRGSIRTFLVPTNMQLLNVTAASRHSDSILIFFSASHGPRRPSRPKTSPAPQSFRTTAHIRSTALAKSTADVGKDERLSQPHRSMNESFMRRALEMAVENVHSGKGGPFAALVVKDGRVVGQGTNIVTSSNDPTAHAEIVAIRDACA